MQIAFILRASVYNAELHRTFRIRQEVEKAGHTVVPLDIADLTLHTHAAVCVFHKDKPLQPFDMGYWTHAWEDKEAWVMLRGVEDAGYPLYESTYMPLGDKVNQAILLAKAGVPIPPTRVLSARQVDVVRKELDFPLVLKGRYGSQGDKVRWIETAEDIESTALSLGLQVDDPLVLQTVVTPLGQDVRAFVVNNQIVAAMERHAPAGDFRANYSLGGTCRATALTADEVLVVQKAHQTMGSPVSGVDFIRTPTGLMVLEVNMWPGFKGLEETTGLNIAAMIVDDMLKKARR